MLGLRLQAHQVDDVDNAHPELREVLAQERRCGERLERRDLARAAEHDVGLTRFVRARPVPDPDPARAVADRVVHRQVVEGRLLAGDDDVDVVATAETVVGDGEQRVRVRRQVDADELGLLVDHVVDEAGILVREAVVVLTPHVRREEVVERGDGPPPGDLPGRLQPLRVLVEHRVDDVDERLVAVEEPVPAGQQVALEPALAEVLGEDLHHAAVGREPLVVRLGSREPGAARHREDVAESVRGRLVRPEETEVVGVPGDHVAQERPEHPRRLARRRAGSSHVDGVVAEVGQHEVAEQRAAVRVRVRAHPPLALGRQRRELGHEPALLVEKLIGPIAPEPLLELTEVRGRVAHRGHRHLVRAPAVLGRLPVDLPRPRPPLRSPQDEHRPPAARDDAVFPRAALELDDPVERVVEGGGEPLVDERGVLAVEAARDEDRPPAVALEEGDQLALGDAGEHGRVRDLEPVQVEDRQDRPVGLRVEELVRVPARGERPGLGLAVADDAGDEQVGVVERRAERVHERVAELAALVDRARHLRRDVARDPARERELAEEPPEPALVRAHVWIALAVRALEVGVRDERRSTVARAGDEDRAQVARPDLPVQVGIEEVEAGHRAEVAEQPRLHMLGLQRLAQERVGEQVDLRDGEVVGGAPVRVEQLEFLASSGAVWVVLLFVMGVSFFAMHPLEAACPKRGCASRAAGRQPVRIDRNRAAGCGGWHGAETRRASSGEVSALVTGGVLIARIR